jgi:hypothetical protein
MTDSRDNEPLLTDVLGEGVAGDFRERLLGETLRLARRRRRFRHARRAGSFLVLAIGVCLLAWQISVPPSKPARSNLHAKPYEIVITRPLASTAWIETRPMARVRLVASAPIGKVITTAAAGRRVPEISDDDLLALAAPKAAVLVRLGPHLAELVFADPADQETLVR